jgi:8-oxo-dGTP pyrophosphatase MutT (NUDIX family)
VESTVATDFAFGPELRRLVLERLAGFEPILLAGEGLRHAAVGVVLVPDEAGRACFVLTRRPSTLRRHAGQWALPGGRLEPGETSEVAALREIYEEVGLDLGPESVLGRLDDYVTRSGHLISPLVAWAPTPRPLEIDPEEVDAAFRIPLIELDDPGALRPKPLLHFAIPSLRSTVHAPTAAMLYQFREVALHGREVRVADVEQPFFAWR